MRLVEIRDLDGPNIFLLQPAIKLELEVEANDLTADAIAAELGGLPAKARRTITHDNGGEFAGHEAVTDAIGLNAYFCDPHSPWQRGSIENANGRLRRDLPRKTTLADYTDADIDDVIWNLNATPRKCLG